MKVNIKGDPGDWESVIRPIDKSVKQLHVLSQLDIVIYGAPPCCLVKK